jgi:tetratricopeptide (TPR) repeat protein
MIRLNILVACLSVMVGLAVTPSPASAQNAQVTQGARAYKAGDYQGAVKAFTAALNAGLTGQARGQVLWYRGACWYRLKQYGRAESDFSQAIALNPGEVHYYVYRGRSRAKLRRYGAALADFNQVVRLKPNYVYGYLYRGLTRALAKQYPGAVADFTRAIQLDPARVETYRLRAMVYQRMGRKAEAAADLAKANQLSAQQGRGTRTVQTPTPRPEPRPNVTTTPAPAPDPSGLWYRRLYASHALYFKIIKKAGAWPTPHAYQVVFVKSSLPLGYRPGTLSMVFTITGPTEARGMSLYIEGGRVRWARCKFTFVDPNTISISMTEPDLAHALPSALHRAR